MNRIVEGVYCRYLNPQQPYLEASVRPGLVMETMAWEQIDTEREMSGHAHAVMGWVTKERWFHPYSGGPPAKCSRVIGRSTRQLDARPEFDFR